MRSSHLKNLKLIDIHKIAYRNNLAKTAAALSVSEKDFLDELKRRFVDFSTLKNTPLEQGPKIFGAWYYNYIENKIDIKAYPNSYLYSLINEFPSFKSILTILDTNHRDVVLDILYKKFKLDPEQWTFDTLYFSNEQISLEQISLLSASIHQMGGDTTGISLEFEKNALAKILGMTCKNLEAYLEKINMDIDKIRLGSTQIDLNKLSSTEQRPHLIYKYVPLHFLHRILQTKMLKRPSSEYDYIRSRVKSEYYTFITDLNKVSINEASKLYPDYYSTNTFNIWSTLNLLGIANVTAIHLVTEQQLEAALFEFKHKDSTIKSLNDFIKTNRDDLWIHFERIQDNFQLIPAHPSPAHPSTFSEYIERSVVTMIRQDEVVEEIPDSEILDIPEEALSLLRNSVESPIQTSEDRPLKKAKVNENFTLFSSNSSPFNPADTRATIAPAPTITPKEGKQAYSIAYLNDSDPESKLEIYDFDLLSQTRHSFTK